MNWDKDKSKALAGTILFHALVLVLLVFMALRTPLPLPGEQGVEVNLGSSNVGLGQKATMVPRKKQHPKTLSKPVSKPAASQPKPQNNPSKEKNLTQNIEKAPALPPKKNQVKKKPQKTAKKKPPKKTVSPAKKTAQKTDTSKSKPVTPPKPVVNPRALFKVAPGTNNQSQGIKPGSGDMGKPHGFKESNQYQGQGGAGHGISFSLGNRGAKFLDKPAAKFSEQGTVVVRIEVNPKGEVINARVYAKGTTVVSEQLRRLAVQSAKNSVFSADPSAPAIQVGTITYHFILKR